jgi:hypothetical protein
MNKLINLAEQFEKFKKYFAEKEFEPIGLNAAEPVKLSGAELQAEVVSEFLNNKNNQL